MNKKSGTILVTGITGLVGSRLLPRLIEAGWNCRALVRKDKNLPAGAIAITGDILCPDTLPLAIKDVAAIIHLAAVFRSTDEELIWKSNLEGTRNLIAAAQEHAPSTRFILASTSNVYNSKNPHPGREDDEVEPQLAYPASKVAAERELQESGLNWSILRFPFIYGDGDGHLEALPKQVIQAQWHPASRMSVIHHLDIATAINMALSGIMDRRIVNISDEAPTSVYELAGLVGEKMDSSAEPLLNPWNLLMDTTLARSLGFQPTVRTVYEAAQKGLM
jgi:nucleoside-diphosphate-sugar epimerase